MSYSAYMTTEEARHALHVLELAHARRILLKHFDHAARPRKAVLFDTDVLYAGDFVKDVAQCEDCFPALTVARLPRKRTVAEAVIDEFSFPVLFMADPPEEEESGD